MNYTENEIIVKRNVEDEMKESYLRYSMSVIISRALPDVRDGLKPSQRRILYAMRQLNLTPGAKHRKCAKICGDTSGDYHPHGEGVIYPTLVRMAQDWSMRYTLVDGQGNFGSVDGDPPAQMRYTEARLTSAALHLMDDLDKDTVDHVPNYDETKKEPVVFPSKFPNLLCNGSSGIAVGMATNIAPHNFQELIKATMLLIDDPNLSIDEIMKVMPAPDFPTGGIICGYRGVKEAFHTGRGKIILRANILVEEPKQTNEKTKLVVDELPYGVNKARVIEHIADLIHNKDITGIADLRDESDKQGMRIVFELKRGEIPDVIINQLYKFSAMQVTFGCNMVALDKGLPKVMNIKQMILAWVNHRIEVVRRRARFELNKAEARSHLLEGYLKAIDNMDEVVRIIRSSDNKSIAKEALISKFQFTEKQANAVLELRLYQLTGLEHEKIQNEYEELQKKIEYLKSILGSEDIVRGIIKDELTEISKKYSSPRQTKIMAAEGEFAMEDLIADETTIITVSHDDYVKRMPMDVFREQRRGGLGVSGMKKRKDTDAVKDVYIASTHDRLLVFTTLGRVYWLKVWQIPESGRNSKGRPLINLLENIQKNEKIATILCVKSFEDKDHCILMATEKGVVKKTTLEAYSNPRKKGIYALTIRDGDQLLTAKLISNDQQVMMFTRSGRAVRFDASQVRSMGRTASGVRGVRLRDEDDRVVGCDVVTGNDCESILVVCENGFGKRTRTKEFRQTSRGSVGVRSIITSERNGLVVAAMAVCDTNSVIMMASSGQTIRFGVKDLRILGRSTQGVKLVNLRKDDKIIAVQKIDAQENDDEPKEECAPCDDIEEDKTEAKDL